MVAKVVGLKKIEFENDKNEKVSGVRLYIEYKDPETTGIACDKRFFPDDGAVKLPEIVLGHDYEFIMQVQGFSGKASLVGVKKV